MSGNPADLRVTDASDSEPSLHKTFTCQHHHGIQICNKQHSAIMPYKYVINSTAPAKTHEKPNSDITKTM